MTAETQQTQERHREVAHRLTDLLTQDGPSAMATAALSLRQADIAEAMEPMDPAIRLKVFLALPPDHAAEVLEECTPEVRDELLDSASDQSLLQILAEADTDDAVYFLDYLDNERAAHLLGSLQESIRGQLSEQFDLPEDCAGRLMARDLIALQPFMTATQAIEKVRALSELRVPALYVTTAAGKLVGTVGFRQLVFAPPKATIDSLMNRDVIYAQVSTDAEEAVRLMQKYELYAIPVVDERMILRGMITLDDAFDIMEAEADEDILAVAGTSENLEDNDSVFGRSMKRLPYLLITVVGGFLIASMIEGQSEAISEYTMLVSFLPLVPALAGNIGIQCSTVTLRYIVGGDGGLRTVRGRIVRELLTGGFLAIIMSFVAMLGALGIAWANDYDFFLAWVITFSMFLAIIFAAANGVAIPLACVKLKIDPAIAAGPFIVMLCDIGGIAIYLVLASMLLTLF